MTSLTTALGGWIDPATPKGRLGLQLWINSSLLSAVLVLHVTPWVALAAAAALLGLTIWLQGRANAATLLVYGVFGYVGELWIVGLGGVWTFRVATFTVLDGGVLGVPFYMVPVWSIVGALMLALLANAGWRGPDRDLTARS